MSLHDMTPLPWFSAELELPTSVMPIPVSFLQGPRWIIQDKSVGMHPDDAAFIVTAVNSYAANQATIKALTEALEPFSKMAGELFARNWNRDDIVSAYDSPDAPCRITAGDFFAARTALTLSRGEQP